MAWVARGAAIVGAVSILGCSGRSLVGADASASGGEANDDDPSDEADDGTGDDGNEDASIPETGFDEADDDGHDETDEADFGDDGWADETTSEPACASVLAESRACAFLGPVGDIHVVGLDSGSACDLTDTAGGWVAGSVPGGLAWIDDVFYVCVDDLVRIEQATGSVETSDVPCQWVTQRDGTLLLYDGASGDLALHEYEDWAAVLAHTWIATHSLDGMLASRFAAVGDTLYGAWHSTDRVLRMELGSSILHSDIELANFDDWVDGIDVDGGELLISSHGTLLRFDLATGGAIGEHVLADDGQLPFDCRAQ